MIIPRNMLNCTQRQKSMSRLEQKINGSQCISTPTTNDQKGWHLLQSFTALRKLKKLEGRFVMIPPSETYLMTVTYQNNYKNWLFDLTSQPPTIN